MPGDHSRSYKGPRNDSPIVPSYMSDDAARVEFVDRVSGTVDPGPPQVDAMAEAGTSLEQIVDLIKRSDRDDAIALLRQTLTVERRAGFIDGMKHMDGVTRKTFDLLMPSQETK